MGRALTEAVAGEKFVRDFAGVPPSERQSPPEALRRGAVSTVFKVTSPRGRVLPALCRIADPFGFSGVVLVGVVSLACSLGLT